MTVLRSTPVRTDVRAATLAAAREALAICEGADRLAELAEGAVGVDDNRMFSLLDERERMLAGLAGYLAVLEPRAPQAESLVRDLCAALSVSERRNETLAARVVGRIDALREELATVQRAGSAVVGYAPLGTTPHVDRVR